MIGFIPVTQDGFQSVYEKMTAAFPYEERRDIDDQKKCLDNGYFNFFEIVDNGTKVGFISLWNFQSYL